MKEFRRGPGGTDGTLIPTGGGPVDRPAPAPVPSGSDDGDSLG